MGFPLEYGAVNSVKLAAWRAQHTQQDTQLTVDLAVHMLTAAPMDWYAPNVPRITLLVGIIIVTSVRMCLPTASSILAHMLPPHCLAAVSAPIIHSSFPRVSTALTTL